MNGLHLIGDLTGCRCDPQLLLDGERFRAKCLDMVANAGLTTMDATFHSFDGGGFTGTVVLAESHLAIHTWPERQGLTLDVYVCNYSADNSAKARKLFEQLVEHFQPTEVAKHELDRGEHMLMEPLNASTGFYIRADKQIGEWQTKFQKMQIYDTPHYGKLFRLDGFNMTSEKEELVYHENLIHPSPVAQPARVAELAQRLNGLFRIVRVYPMYIPLYGSLWAMAVCSDKLDPKAFTADEIDRRIEARKLQELRYYNGETHEGVFALPNFVRDLVTPARLKQPTRGRRLGVGRAAVK